MGKKVGVLLFLLVLLLLFMGLALGIGTASIPFSRIPIVLWNKLPFTAMEVTAFEETIIWMIRFPRVLLAVLVGASLSAAGMVFQGLFHNPMADPFVLGISSGAALGATIALVFHLDFQFLTLSSVPLLAFIGGISTTLLVYNLGRVGSKVPLTYVLLSGIAVGAFLTSVNSLLLVLNRDEMHRVVFWMMGGFSGRGWPYIRAVLPYLLLGLTLIGFSLEKLNILSLGEDKASQLGLNVNRMQFLLIGAASLATAAAVSASGIIGFVGLIVPHVIRLLLGPDHRFVFPGSLMVGGMFLLLSDTLARTLLSPQELPVGVITSLCGAPFFLYLLYKHKKGLR